MRIFFTLLMLILTIDPAVTTAEVYKYTDENGVVSFTDDFDKIPEARRPGVEKSEAPVPAPSFEPPIAPPRNGFFEWFGRPLSKYIVGFTALAVFTLFVQSRSEGLLLRLALKVLFIGFLGAAVYSILVARGLPLSGPSLSSLPSLVETAESNLPKENSITKVKNQLDRIEQRQKEEEALIESLSGPERKR